MPLVHYKFKSSLDYKTLTVDGIQISVGELKKLIYEKEKIGKSADFDLQITNFQTKQVYEDESAPVPRNASVIVARIPTAVHQKLPKVWDTRTEGKVNRNPTANQPSKPTSSIFHGDDMAANSGMSEDEKLRMMQLKSTQDYDPSQYQRGRQNITRGPAPSTFRCSRCGQIGDHWVKDCPLANVRRPTGIPKDELMDADPDDPQAMLTPGGRYVVAIMDKQAHLIGKKERPPFFEEEASVVEPEPKREVPPELMCSLCNDLLREAVLIPCCGYSFCDECIRNRLLESGHECPRAECREKASPDSLVPNSQLRKAVSNFRNDTGYAYVKRGRATVATRGPTNAPTLAQATTTMSGPTNRLVINLVSNSLARAQAAEQKTRAGSAGPDATASPGQQQFGSTQSPDTRERAASPAVGLNSVPPASNSGQSATSHASAYGQPPASVHSAAPMIPPPIRMLPPGPPLGHWPPVSIPPSVMTAPPIHSIHVATAPQMMAPTMMHNMMGPPPMGMPNNHPQMMRYPHQPTMHMTGPPGVHPMAAAQAFPQPPPTANNAFMTNQPPPPGVLTIPPGSHHAPVVTTGYVVTRPPGFTAAAQRRPLTEAEFYDAKRKMVESRFRDRPRPTRPNDAWEEFLARKDRKKRRSSSRSSRGSSRSRSRSGVRSRRSRSRSASRSRSRSRSSSYHKHRRSRRDRSRSYSPRPRGGAAAVGGGRARSRTPTKSRNYNARRPRRSDSRKRTRNSPPPPATRIANKRPRNDQHQPGRHYGNNSNSGSTSKRRRNEESTSSTSQPVASKTTSSKNDQRKRGSSSVADHSSASQPVVKKENSPPPQSTTETVVTQSKKKEESPAPPSTVEVVESTKAAAASDIAPSPQPITKEPSPLPAPKKEEVEEQTTAKATTISTAEPEPVASTSKKSKSPSHEKEKSPGEKEKKSRKEKKEKKKKSKHRKSSKSSKHKKHRSSRKEKEEKPRRSKGGSSKSTDSQQQEKKSKVDEKK